MNKYNNPKMQIMSPKLNGLMQNSVEGLRDLADGLHHWRMWYLIGSADMRRRYARSHLGQIWIMLSSLVTVSTMGVVWSFLWNIPIKEMLPFVALGTIIWQLFSGVISESTTIHESNKQYYLNQYIPASAILFALVYRYASLFALNMIFPIILAILLGSKVGYDIFLAIPGFVILIIACFWMSFIVSLFCARYRDIIQIISSALLILNYLTPVVWKPENLAQNAQEILALNPISSLIAIVRDPLLGRPYDGRAWLIAIFLSFGGLLLSLPIIGKYRRRLIYWL